MKIIILCIFIVLIISPVISAYQERSIFIVDSNGNTQYKYQLIVAVDQGYYIPGQSIDLVVPINSTNLKFFNNNGEVNPTLKTQSIENETKTYSVVMNQVEYGSPQFIGFTYDLLEYTTIRYKENYFLEFPYYIDIESNKETYVCIPSSASRYANSYDSTPKDYNYPYLNNYNYTLTAPPLQLPPLIISPSSPGYISQDQQIAKINICPSGYYENTVYGLTKGISTELNFDFKDSSNRIDNYEKSFEPITVNGPSIYESFIDKNIPSIVKTIPTIDSKLNLNSLPHYNVNFVSDNDLAMTDNNDILSYEDGKVLYKVNVIKGDDQFLQINLLRGIIGSSMIKTYGLSIQNNWWDIGSTTNMALILMKENNLPTSEIQKTLKTIKDAIKKLTPQEIKDSINDNSGDKILIYSSIVDEIDSVCPDHVLKLNAKTRGMTQINFTSEKEFNNFLIYNIENLCSKDISNILDKYGFEHDSVMDILTRYNNLQAKFSEINIDREDIPALNTLKSNLNKIKSNLEEGKIEDSTQLVSDSETLYETRLKPLLQILGDFSNAEQKSNSIPFIFALPSKIIINSNLDGAIGYIKENNFDGAKQKINNSLFWINNAIMLSIIFYIIILSLIILFYKKYRKHKKHNHNKKDDHGGLLGELHDRGGKDDFKLLKPTHHKVLSKE